MRAKADVSEAADQGEFDNGDFVCGGNVDRLG
jgi:hypothetical protein